MFNGVLKGVTDVINVYALIFILMCGNAFLFGVDLFTILFLPYALVLLLGGIVSKSYSRWLMLIIFFFILYLAAYKAIALEIPYFEPYYLWPIKACLCFFVLSISKTLQVAQINRNALYLLSLAGLLFLFLVNIAGYLVDGRLSFVFGPNMLYRFVIAVTLIPLVMYLIIKDRNLIDLFILISLLALSLVTLARIGSKGGVVVFASALFILFLLRWGWRWYVASGLLLVAATVLVHDYSFHEFRFINFNGIQESIRYVFLIDFLENMNEIPILGYDWEDFHVHATPGFQYPHNSILEMVYYFGVLGVILVAIVLSALHPMKAYMLKIYDNGVMQYQVVLICLFIIVLISSLFSGDMSDNFVLISLAMYGVSTWKSH